MYVGFCFVCDLGMSFYGACVYCVIVLIVLFLLLFVDLMFSISMF